MEKSCKNCGKPIPKYSHSLRLFCPNELELDGSVTSCKDDYNNLLKKPKYDMIKAIGERHWKYFLIIDSFYKKEVKVVDEKTLKEAGLDLNFCLKREQKSEGTGYYLYYIQYRLSTLANGSFRIWPHSSQLLFESL